MYIIVIEMSFLLVSLSRLAGFPVGAHFFNLLLVIKIGIVVFAHAANALVPRQVLGVDGDTVVFRFPACSNILPATFLFFEIETGGVWEEKQSQQHTSETEPRHDVEFLLGGDVIAHDGGSQGPQFTTSGGETMSRGPNGGRKDLGGNEEGNGVGTKLVEEGGEEVHDLEFFDVCI